jgi:transposase
VELVTSVRRRRRWTSEQKLEIVKQTNEPGSSVSLVARQHGLTAAQLFQWRKAYLEGSLVAVGANETVVPASELQEAIRRIKQLEGALGCKTLENEIHQEAVDFAKGKKWIALSPVLTESCNKSGVHGNWRIAQQLLTKKTRSTERADLRTLLTKVD